MAPRPPGLLAITIRKDSNCMRPCHLYRGAVWPNCEWTAGVTVHAHAHIWRLSQRLHRHHPLNHPQKNPVRKSAPTTFSSIRKSSGTLEMNPKIGGMLGDAGQRPYMSACSLRQTGLTCQLHIGQVRSSVPCRCCQADAEELRLQIGRAHV